MNRGLLWVLVGTGALSGWALLNPTLKASPAATMVVAAAPTRIRPDGTNTPPPLPEPAPTGDGASTTAVMGALPAHWPETGVEQATRNPFIATAPPAPKPVAAPVVASPPPALPPPVSDYRFWGRMAVQGGQHLTYVARGDTGTPVAIDIGTRLEDGWSVESVGDNAIELVHAATLQRSTLAIPLHAPTNQK
jgi:hypothetical protein